MNYRLWALMPLISFVSCQKNVNITESSIVSGSDPYFKIVAHSDPDFASTNRKVDALEFPFTPMQRLKMSNYCMLQTS